MRPGDPFTGYGTLTFTVVIGVCRVVVGGVVIAAIEVGSGGACSGGTGAEGGVMRSGSGGVFEAFGTSAGGLDRTGRLDGAWSLVGAVTDSATAPFVLCSV
jgi:hypothetical protein